MSAPVFGPILGQIRALETLAAAIASGRVHHAWIFHGPAGVGKRTTAEFFARALLTPGVIVERGVVLAAPGTLVSVTHPDLHVVTKELARHSDDAGVRSRKLTSIPKEVLVERVLRPAALAPTVGAASAAKKVFIIDEAELIAPVAQNALLKTLEEPPAGTVLILVTSSEERLLPTIRSRCQRVAFGPLDDAAIRAWAEREGVGATDAALALARGAPGALYAVAARDLAGAIATLEPMLAAAESGRFDPALGATLGSLVDEWANAEVEEKKALNPSKDAANKAAVDRLADLLLERARKRLRGSAAGSAEQARALRDIEIITTTESRLASNVNLRLALDNLAAQLAR